MAEIRLEPLKGRIAIAELFKTGRRVHASPAIAFVKFADCADESDSHTIKYVVTVSKRNAKKSVVRNRIKRLLRVSLNIIKAEYIDKVWLSWIDSILISWKKAPEHPMMINLNDVLPVVRDLFEIIGSVNTSISKKG